MDNDGFKSIFFEHFNGFVFSVDDEVILLGEVIEDISEEFSLSIELHILESFLASSLGLNKTSLSSVGDINECHYDFLEVFFEELTFAQLSLEISTTSENESLDEWQVILQECFLSLLGYFLDPINSGGSVMTSKSHRGLSSLVMLVWEVDLELIQDSLGITLDSGEKGRMTINNDKSVHGFIKIGQISQFVEMESIIRLENEMVHSLPGNKIDNLVL